MIYAGKEIKTIFIGNRVLTSAYVGSVNVYVSAKPFSECTWAEIKEIADAGLASQYFALGDTKTDTDANNVEHTFRIVQFVYGGNALLLEDLSPLQPYSIWNDSANADDDSAYNNYSISDMRETGLPDVLLTYPSALRAVINDTEYKVAKNGNSTDVLTLTDKLFLGAEKEYFGSRSRSVQAEADALSQFALYAQNNTDEFRQKNYAPDTPASYWMRSPNSGSSSNACMVYIWGYSSTGDAVSTTTRKSPLFCIGDYATRTIPYIGNSTLTSSYVSTWASKIQASVRAGCTKIVVPQEFTNYESGALDAIFEAFVSMRSFESPWLNGNTTDGFEWTISYTGSATLTASYVNGLLSADAVAFAGVKRIVIPADFTAIEDGALDGVDTFMASIDTLETTVGTKAIYTNFTSTNGKIKNVIHHGTEFGRDSWAGCLGINTFIADEWAVPVVYQQSVFIGCNYLAYLELTKLNNPNGVRISAAIIKEIGSLTPDGATVCLPNYVGVNLGWDLFNGCKIGRLFLPKAATAHTTYADPAGKIYLNNEQSSLSFIARANVYGRVYQNAKTVAALSADTTRPNVTAIGVIDGAGTYQSMRLNPLSPTLLSMNYPALSSTLTIDQNGHLIENGVDLFTGYTAKWYSDEDCTTAIADPTTITSSMTAYVKLTAI